MAITKPEPVRGALGGKLGFQLMFASQLLWRQRTIDIRVRGHNRNPLAALRHRMESGRLVCRRRGRRATAEHNDGAGQKDGAARQRHGWRQCKARLFVLGVHCLNEIAANMPMPAGVKPLPSAFAVDRCGGLLYISEARVFWLVGIMERSRRWHI